MCTQCFIQRRLASIIARLHVDVRLVHFRGVSHNVRGSKWISIRVVYGILLRARGRKRFSVGGCTVGLPLVAWCVDVHGDSIHNEIAWLASVARKKTCVV